MDFYLVHEVIVHQVKRAQLASAVYAVRVRVQLAPGVHTRLPHAISGQICVRVISEEHVEDGQLSALRHTPMFRQGLANVVAQALVVVPALAAKHRTELVNTKGRGTIHGEIIINDVVEIRQGVASIACFI